MDTAISIPDDLYETAERLRKQAGLSRSELYAKALTSYLKRTGDDAITQQINRVCADVDTSADEFILGMQAHGIPPEKW